MKELVDARYVAASIYAAVLVAAHALPASAFQALLGASVAVASVAWLASRGRPPVAPAARTTPAEAVDKDSQHLLQADLLGVRRTLPSGRWTATQPPVAALLSSALAPFRRANAGGVAAVRSYVEHFFRVYFETLAMSEDDGSSEVQVRHNYELLADLRVHIANSLLSLVYAKPHAHASREATLAAVDVLKARTARCLKTLHNKFGRHALRAVARGAPHGVDAARVRDAFFVHV